MKKLDIAFYSTLSILGIYLFGYIFYGVGPDFIDNFVHYFFIYEDKIVFQNEIVKNMTSYLGITNFQMVDYYFKLLLVSFIVMYVTGLISKKFNYGYIFLLGSIVFGTTAYFLDILRYGFIPPAVIFFVIFLFTSVFPKIKNVKNKALKANGIKVKGNFKAIVTNYGFKMNGRPAKKIQVEVVHPHNGKKITVESENIFDYSVINDLDPNIDVYFDQKNYNSFLIDYKIKETQEKEEILRSSVF